MKFSTIAHSYHTMCSPIFDEKLERLLEAMAMERGETLLDIGCGKGEALVAAVEMFGVSAVGIDQNSTFLKVAREVSQSVEGKFEWRKIDAREFLEAGRVFDHGICVGASHAVGTFEDSLAALRKAVRPGGSVLVGDSYWLREPDARYLEFLGGDPSEVRSHRETLEAVRAAGFDVLYSATSSLDEWDHYEGLYLSGIERYAEEAPDDPDVPEMLNRIRAWRDAYEQWGREVMGFAWIVARRQP